MKNNRIDITLQEPAGLIPAVPAFNQSTSRWSYVTAGSIGDSLQVLPSGELGFAPSGGGAGQGLLVASSGAPLQVKARADYICDGVDDQVEIQAALASSRAVYMSAGPFFLSAQVVLTENSFLSGQGVETLVFWSDNVNTDIFVMGGNPNNNDRFMVLQNMRIEANKANNTNGHTVSMANAQQSMVYNLHIKESAEDGIHLNGYNPTNLALDNWVIKNKIDNVGRIGIFNAEYAPNNHIYENILAGAGFHCMEIANSEVKVSHNHVSNGGSSGIYISGGERCDISLNHSESNGQYGIHESVNGKRNSFVGNQVFNNGSVGLRAEGVLGTWVSNHSRNKEGVTSQAIGLEVLSTASIFNANSLTENGNFGIYVGNALKNALVANTASSDTLPVQQANGIYLDSGAVDTKVTANITTGNIADYTDIGVGTVFGI